MAVHTTLFQHYLAELRRRLTRDYDHGRVFVSVPEMPGIVAEGGSEAEAEWNYSVAVTSWLIAQLEAGWPVPRIGEHELNSDRSRDTFMQETGLTIPYLKQQPDPDQMWFWTPEWQAREREAAADLASGRTERFETDEDFVAALEARRHADV